MNLPNILTISRIGFAIVLVYLLLLNTLVGNILAAFFFAVASLTDFYDGYLAKKQGLVSDFGKIMDPIADKVLMLSIFYVLVHIKMVNGWMVNLIALREVGVTIDRLVCMRKGQVVAAERAGKIKTIFQMTTVSVILIYLIFKQAFFSHSWFIQIQSSYLGWINVFMSITVLLTIASGISYFQNRIKSLNRKALATFFATFLGVGFFPVAPGTAATAVGIILAFMLKFNVVLYICVTLALLVVAIPVCTYLEKVIGKKDPGMLVIDEVVGILISLVGLPLSWPIVISGFFLFRALDMFKIYPINRLEGLPGGFGIMMDDVMAGLYTNIALHIAARYAGLI